ncbi:hypothetical protein Nepgr_015918 [Nepenthes gracilis]|uniref:Uncharacterized protein n=1 Tax=Nepenthes gracilis TaxID=150966 RepID=A0AAD3SMW6_NEPGR|nr:hypothetical protein Nepgr_015918 [Nepenthes gracilis]
MSPAGYAVFLLGVQLLVIPGQLAFCLGWICRDALFAWMTALCGTSGLAFLRGWIGSRWWSAFVPGIHQMQHNGRAECFDKKKKEKGWQGWIARDWFSVRNAGDGISIWNAKDDFLEF